MGESEPSQRACRGGAALELTEKALCGSGAVATAAAAEGLALSGVRAARLLADEEVRPVTQMAASVPWVLHRTTLQRARGGAFGAFELVASDAQEAADHSLVAHLSALAGDLLVDPAFARRLWLFRPPAADSFLPLLAETASREPLVVDEDAVGRELGIAFEKVSAFLGRFAGPLTAERVAEAEVVLVTTADARTLALEAARALGDRVKCGVVSTALVRPFPVKALATMLAGKRVVLLEPAWVRGRLAAGVRAAIGADGPALPSLDPFGPSPIPSLYALLGLAGEPKDSLPPEPPRFVMGVVPAGARAEALLCDVAARLAEVGPISIAEPERTGDAPALLAVGRSRVSARPADSIDLLLVADPVLLDVAQVSGSLAEGGVVVLASAATSAEALYAELTAAQRDVLRRRAARVYWLDTRAHEASQLDTPTLAWLSLERALLEAGARGLAERLGLDESRFRASGGEPLLSPVALTASTAPRAVPSVPDRPLMPAAAQTQAAPRWRSALRRFHVTGQGAAGPSALLPLAPAAVSAWLARGVAQPLPLLVDAHAAQRVVPLEQCLAEASGKSGVVAEHVPRLVAVVAHELSLDEGAAPVEATLERALARFAAEFELSTAAKKSFDAELVEFRGKLPKTGTLLGLSAHTHLQLYVAVVLAERESRSAALVDQIRDAASGLAERLRLEASRSPQARSAEGLGAVLGEGAAFVDPAALAKKLPRSRGPRPLDDARKRRIERALATLQGFLAELPKRSKLVVVHSGSVPDALDLGRTERVRHAEGFEVAAGIFDGVARQMADVFRALHVARLELDGAYDPLVHDEGLAALEWRGFSEQELLLVPPVVVVETADRVWKSSLDALSRLLRSGRPIHVLVEESAAISGPAGLGYVLVAHREALVLQGTLARPLHLADGLRRMAMALRPAVVLVAPRPPTGPMPAWLTLSASLEGRALPPFLYDPDAGGSSAECFDIGENPAPELAWPTARLDIQLADGGAGSLDTSFTFADAAALDLEMRSHFWLIPPEGWSDEQVELAAYLASPERERLQRLPFIWVVGEDGRFARAIVSRELAFACRERLRIWHVIQELGGSANEHARRAADAARRGADSEAQLRRQELEAAHAKELERVRNEEASVALGRLAQALLHPGALVQASAVVPPPARVGAPPSPAAVAAPALPPAAAAADEAEVVSFTDPYIDTPLCTSCNECLNINALMFKYNADKQAILADAKAGTFLQLVAAAEKCPAACIHPGVPRKDDKTVNDDLVARAARFN